eukprot:CAMPEP_0118961578 /NCGR_PEP_ID=MMETSP1173-20130426/213_1 /TAXON_ID=1034831 /ORGANISM="Rhizochromulina marina cf, Strain CCMP1243" /LENGTH=100 /DNA_ID=CAMNT_0006909757 /DNA_START=456 /DNA_END=754 /DNA_ORIENTATION=-
MSKESETDGWSTVGATPPSENSVSMFSPPLLHRTLEFNAITVAPTPRAIPATSINTPPAGEICAVAVAPCLCCSAAILLSAAVLRAAWSSRSSFSSSAVT